MNQYKRFELVELDEFIGYGAAIYSIALDDNEDTLFDQFVAQYATLYPDEVSAIVNRLDKIARLGARLEFFRPYEGTRWGADGLVALFDQPDKHLRLYCIRFGSTTLVVGGGGPKPKEVDGKKIRAFQEIPKLKDENYLLRAISRQINQAIKDKDIQFDGNHLAGQLVFGAEEDE